MPHPIEVHAPVRNFAGSIATAAVATICTFGGALAYYLPWCVTAVERTATARTLPVPGVPDQALYLQSVLDDTALTNRCVLPGVALALPSLGSAASILTARNVPVPDLADAAAVMAYEDQVFGALLGLVASNALWCVAVVIIGWFLGKYALEQLQVAAEGAAPVRLAVDTRGSTAYLAVWTLFSVFTMGLALLAYPTHALKRACNRARGTTNA